MNDLISRQTAIDEIARWIGYLDDDMIGRIQLGLKRLPSAQPERLTDDDFETIRIHLNAYKEKLCNQHRWEEADEYQRIIDRFMAFASAQPDMSEYSDKLWKAAYERGKAEAQPDLDEVYAHAETEAEARYHAQQRWIPCSERLPEKDGDYLTTLIDKDGNYVDVTEWQNIIGGRWVAPLDECDYCEIGNVVAWMPLPEPYREDES